MKRSTPMVERAVRGFCRLPVYALLCLWTLGGCTDETTSPADPYSALPVFERSVAITDGADTLSPVRVQMVGDTLFVSYNGRPRLDLFTPELKKIGSLDLTDPEPVNPTSFFVADSAIYVCDHAKAVVATYDRAGRFETSFGLLPDQATRISPLALTFYGGVLYLTDIRLRSVLAISMVDAEGITEKGELILSIPADPSHAAGFPSAVHVTIDGRLLVGDAGDGLVRVFTCDGQPVYTFDSVPSPRTMAPQEFAIDGIRDPSLQDTSSFDPSGLRVIGRIHVADGNNARVHMFSPLGRFIATYPSDDNLIRPSGIAIGTQKARIYIADPQARRIFVYTYRS